MPILDVEIVVSESEPLSDGLATALADAAGKVFDASRGNVWVRVRPLPRHLYAENGVAEPEGWRSVFVTVLKYQRPDGSDLEREVRLLTEAVARICGRAPENVHILYEADAAGRIAFGGAIKK